MDFANSATSSNSASLSADRPIQRDHARHAEVPHVLDVFFEIRQAALERAQILDAEILLVRAAVHLERPHRRDDDRCFGIQAAHAALDVEELFGAEIRSESRFGHDEIGERERRARGKNAVAPVRDVAERTGVHERGAALERLHEVRPDRVLEQQRHRAGRAELARCDGTLRRAVGRANE